MGRCSSLVELSVDQIAVDLLILQRVIQFITSRGEDPVAGILEILFGIIQEDHGLMPNLEMIARTWYMGKKFICGLFPFRNSTSRN